MRMKPSFAVSTKRLENQRQFRGAQENREEANQSIKGAQLIN